MGVHPAPADIALPIGTVVRFTQPVREGRKVSWIGGREVERTLTKSTAECRLDTAGEHIIRTLVRSRKRSESFETRCTINVLDIPLEAIQVGPVTATVDPVDLNEDSHNMATMGYFFGASIAELIELPDPNVPRHLTSVGRSVTFSALADPPEMGALMEWRLDGRPIRLGLEVPRKFYDVGNHVFAVGPIDQGAGVEIETYRAKITSHKSNVDILPEGEQITFEAVTDPPGYEEYITWLSSTKYGTGTPVLGSGPTFTVQFDDTFGDDSLNGWFQWLGVKADNTRFNQDQKPCPDDTCSFMIGWKKDKEDGAAGAPASWVPLPDSGTTQGDINWLHSWDTSDDWFNFGESVCGLSSCFSDSLTDAEKEAIVAACENETTTLAKILCAGREVRDTLDDDPANVCRHHAIALEAVLEALGITADLECAYKNWTGHAWTETIVADIRYLLDAYNAVYVCVQP